jgi:hypothetical protein
MLNLAFLAALLAPSAQAEKKETIAVSLKDHPPSGKAGPGFLCEGTADLPDGARLDILFYFGAIEYGYEIHRHALALSGGKYSHVIHLFPKKNLGGTYRVRVLFNPFLQQEAPLQGLPKQHADATLQVGDEAAVRQDHAAARASLVERIRAIQALGSEVVAHFESSKGKLDKAAWEKLYNGWRDRCLAIEGEAAREISFKLLGLSAIVDAGLENLRNILLEVIRSAANGQEGHVREGRVRLDRTADAYAAKVAPAVPPEDIKKEFLARAAEARAVLKEATGAQGEALAALRKRFVGITLALQKRILTEYQEDLFQIAADGNALFQAVSEKKEAARALHEKLDRKLEEMIRRIEKEQ